MKEDTIMKRLIMEGVFLKNLTPDSPIDYFWQALVSEMTAYDARANVRPHAMALYLEAIDDAKKQVGNRGSKRDLLKALRDAFTFDPFRQTFDLPPVNKVAKKYGLYDVQESKRKETEMKKTAKTIEIKEEIQLPGTNIILEKGDKIRVIEKGVSNTDARDEIEDYIERNFSNFKWSVSEIKAKAAIVLKSIKLSDYETMDDLRDNMKQITSVLRKDEGRMSVGGSVVNENRDLFRGYRFVDEEAMYELLLFMENEGKLYNQYVSIVKNIQQKIKSGRYDASLAPKLWSYWVMEGAREYILQFGSPGTRMQDMFSKKDKDELARYLADTTYEEIQAQGGQMF